jgi:hypothetical protein
MGNYLKKKTRYHLIRQFQEDLFSVIFSKKKKVKLLNLLFNLSLGKSLKVKNYFYRVVLGRDTSAELNPEYGMPFIKKRYYKFALRRKLALLKFKHFFGFSRLKYLKYIWYKFHKKKRNYGILFHLIFDLRLDMLFYRFFFFENLIKVRKFIEDGNLLINGIANRNICYRVKPLTDIFSFYNNYNFIKKLVKQRMKKPIKIVYWSKYFLINYFTGHFILLPFSSHGGFPFPFNFRPASLCGLVRLN